MSNETDILSPNREDASEGLLAWYDRHAREMPWRVGPDARSQGVRPDPYGVWLSEVMLQQTTVAAVKKYWLAFTDRWPTVQDLAAAEDADVMAAWAGLGYYARARNLLKCARVVTTEHGGAFPTTYTALLDLPGIGPYTASAIAAIAFDQAETVVDGNVERVITRYYMIDTPLPQAKQEISERARTLTNPDRPGDYAQAIMDLGATICTPRNPACGICPWAEGCAARTKNRQLDYPKKAPKKVKPTRRGYVYLGTNGTDWLVERRPAKGLLGGMLGFPGSDWSEVPEPSPPFAAEWQTIGEVRHTFTHFHLVLEVQIAHCAKATNLHPLEPNDLPTVFRKAFKLVQGFVRKD